MYHSIGRREETDRKSTQAYLYTLEVREQDEPILSHWHPEAEIIYCKCSGTAYIGDAVYRFQENDVIMVNKNELHHVKVTSDGVLYCFLFSYSYLDFKLNDWCSSHLIAPLDSLTLLLPPRIDEAHPLHYKIVQLLRELLNRYGEDTPGRPMKIKSLLYELLFELCDGRCLVTSKSDCDASSIELVKEVVSYMNENINESITLDDLSKRLHLSKGHIIHLFKTLVGQTPIVYLRNLRLEYASTLLEGGAAVTQAACRCGMANVSYFIREYKKKYGKTPKRHHS